MTVKCVGASASHLRQSSRSDRKGFALAAALLMIVLIGAIAAAVLFATTEETRVGSAGVAGEVALIACESAIVMTITDRGITLPDSIGVAGTTSRRVEGFGLPVVVYITRLDSALYAIVADAVVARADQGGRRRIGIVAKRSVAPDHSITIDPISEQPWSDLF
jgi:hypothetical protein